MMKKLYQMRKFGILLIFMFIVIGCGTVNLGVYSTTLKTTEQEQLCNLTIDSKIGITGFNGKPVQWGIAPAGQVSDRMISIPAGKNLLRYEYRNETEKSVYFAWGTFSHEFIPGHSYDIAGGYGGVVVKDRTDKSLSKTYKQER